MKKRKVKPAAAGDPGDGHTQAVHPALDRALNTLEDILEGRHVVPDEHHPETEETDPEDLPVLQDMVIPGRPMEHTDHHGPPAPAEVARPAPPHDDLIRRLVSELDIIIEGCVDEALAEARRELMVRLKNHMDIVLPEILEELERRQQEEGLPPED